MSRSSRRIRRQELSGGETSPTVSRRSLPPGLSNLDRQTALKSPYGAVGPSYRSGHFPSPQPFTARRLPALQASYGVKPSVRKDPLSSLALEGLKHQRFCHARKTRRQVLFARQVAGRRGGSPGRRHRYRRTFLSQFSCGG